MKSTLYLASASPRRHELLNQIEVQHEILHVPSPPGEDEPKLASENPLEYVQRTALDKAERAQLWAVQKKLHLQNFDKQIAILTADTTVAFNTLVLGKPQDDHEAAEILRMLSGQTHTVHTALVLSCLVEGGNKWQQAKALSSTQVTFAKLSEETINKYIATKEPFGKAGAYGIQGAAATFIQRIEGSYSGVMGLPLFETHALLSTPFSRH